jgi:large subunit ribosomal protein L15
VKIHDLKPAPGSRTARRRPARGIAGRRGKTAGRGMKGQKARDTIPMNFEGGQMPMHMRVPKLKGFKNPFRVAYQAVNLDVLDATGLDELGPDELRNRGLVHKGALVKVLGRGQVGRAIRVRAHGFSKAAEQAITEAGGSVEVLPLPWGDRRPPAKGNHLTNR